MTIRSFFYKSFYLALVLCFTFTAVYIPQHYTKSAAVAHAALATEGTQVVNTTNNIFTRMEMGINNFLTTTIANFSSLDWWYDQVLDKIAWALAKAIISAIMRDIVRWINSGFQGSPAFIQDLGGFLTDVADATAGRFLQEVGGPLSIVCSPFRLNIQIALATAYNRTRDRNARRCTLTGALQNIQNFIGGDFSQGGWNSWLQITQNPGQYTEAGALLEASAEMGIRIGSAQGQASIPLNWGMGFLSSKVCDEPESPEGPPKAPGEEGASQGEQAAQPNCRISTPGQVISSSINETLQLGNRSLVEADEINEIIGAFMQQVAVKVLTGASGLLGMGGGGSRYKNPGFNVDLFTSGSNGMDYGGAGATINESKLAALKYVQLAESVIDRYVNSYTTDQASQDRAEGAYNEARSWLPGLKNNAAVMEGIAGEFENATTDAERAAALNKYTSVISSIPSKEVVATQETRWNFALSGLTPRPQDLQIMRRQLDIERNYFNLIDDVMDIYEDITNPTPEQDQANAEAEGAFTVVQRNISVIRQAIEDYERGNQADAVNTYEGLRDDLSSPEEVSTARDNWESVFGALP